MTHLLEALLAGLATLVCLGLGSFVLLKEPGNRVYRYFFALNLTIAGWCFSSLLQYLVPKPDLGLLFWCRILYTGATLVPFVSLAFIFALTGISKPNVIRAILVGSLACSLLNFTTPFITLASGGLEGRSFMIEPGLGHLILVLLMACSGIYGFRAVYGFHHRASGYHRVQAKYILAGWVFGFLAAGVYFLQLYGARVPLSHDLFVIAYISSTAYAIVRYRLMDINIAVARTTVFVAVYALLLGLPLVFALVYQPRLEQFLGYRWWIWPWVAGALLASAAHYINLFLQRKTEATLLREQRHYQATLMNAAKGMVEVRDLSRLLNLIVHLLTRAMKLTHAGVFLLDERAGRYVLQANRGGNRLTPGLALDADDALIQWLKVKRESLIYEEIRQRPTTANGSPSPSSLEASLRRIEAAVAVPSLREDVLIGFLVLGDKRSGQMFSQDDLDVLETLANQGALAFQNAQFFHELQTKTAELIHESKLKSMGKMASGMSHQINNRMACLVAEASSAKEQYLDRLRGATSDAEREILIRELAAKLDSICEEGIKGSTIVKTLLDFSKPTTTFAMASLEEIIRGGLKMVGLKHELHKLNVYVHVPKDHPGVRGNVSQLQDVFFNLVDNACDAIHWKANSLKRGTLHVPESELPYQGQIAVIAKLSEDRTKHLITVADNGLGMTPEDTDRLFLPFHTTKGTAEKGTGLGLFVIREMLKGHRGDIRLEKSEPGRGTTFLVELPIPEEERRWARSNS